MHYYEIMPDGQIVKRTNDAGVGAIYQGKLYYNSSGNSSGLRVCDLTVTDGESRLLGEAPFMCFMTVSAQGVFSRDCPQKSIWFYHLDSGEMECIISQK